MEAPPAARGCHAPGQAQQPGADGLGGHRYRRCTEPDLVDPSAEVVGDDVEGHPDGIGTEATRGQVVETDAVLQVSDHVLDDGVPAVVGLELDHVAFSVGDEGVVVVGGEQGQLAAGGGLYAADDESYLGVLFRERPIRDGESV